MTRFEDDAVPGPRPVKLGCTAAVAALVLVVIFIWGAITFLESGANTGKITLDPAGAYAPGSATFIGDHNLYVVRLPDSTFLALSDLDAANRANPQRRCRVAPIPATDPQLRGLLDRYASQLSASAPGSTLLFREDCNRAIYDVTGRRLDTAAANLDRFLTSVDAAGNLVVDLSKRTCSTRTETTPALTTTCP